MNPIKKIKEEVENLFPKKIKDPSKTYCTRNWIFPNHLNPMIKISKDLCIKYGGDKKICEIACLLHDTGLVYKRKTSSPEGHENNSIEFAKIILEKYKIQNTKVGEILNCIRATETSYIPKTINEKIVRTSDILSQYNGIHFFAKAHFYPTWEMYIKFLERKIAKGFDKICFKEEREKTKPIQNHLQLILSEYKKYN